MAQPIRRATHGAMHIGHKQNLEIVIGFFCLYADSITVPPCDREAGPTDCNGSAMSIADFDIVIQPGWQDSSAEHWQSRWQQAWPDTVRVAHCNWDTPELPRWLDGLDAALAACRKPALVVAHSLGCVTVAHHARRGGRPIAGALLVAPADVERSGVPAALAGFAPIPAAALPFPAILVASDDDPYCPLDRAEALAGAWRTDLVRIGKAGHINAASGLGDWAQGRVLLELLARTVGAAGSARSGKIR